MNIRQRIEENEKNTLSKFASLSINATREVEIDDDGIRTNYQRDRDRIVHCKSFRRLKHKTQVFLSPEGDHYRTRMTHTLEVSQIARTIARALCLNEDLAEAISLGHDLGHTPFGHAGEYILNEICPIKYHHSLQSVRVVKFLEHNGDGLKLTNETIDGIKTHSGGKLASTLEGQIVRFADKIAYMNHDIDDAISAKILTNDDIPLVIRQEVGDTKSRRITTFVKSIINNSTDVIKLDEKTQSYFDLLHDFMFEAVYRNERAKGEEGKAKQLLSSLYTYYLQNIDKLPEFYVNIADKEGKERAVCDYISGMTDNFAIYKYEELFIPKSWGFNK